MFVCCFSFFSNGGLDPWASGGVTRSISDSLVAVVIPDGAHHLDLRYNNNYDPPSVLEARALEVKSFKEWIRQARKKHTESHHSKNIKNKATRKKIG